MDPFLAMAAVAGFATAGVAIYRARTDKESSVSVAARGLAEASAVLVNPMREELVLTRERIVSLEAEVRLAREATMDCRGLVEKLHEKYDRLEARMSKGEEHIEETKEKVIEAEDRITEVENGDPPPKGGH